MAQGPTNVNLIATYIHNNPGCRRVDLKRMLHKATTGKDTDKQHELACKNQYFQRYGSADNVYLDRLWYNEHDKGPVKTRNRWGGVIQTNRTRTSSYQLTSQGKNKVWSCPMLRPFEEGSLIEWQWKSPRSRKRGGWNPVMRGLVVERTDLYGLWILPIGNSANYGNLFHVSHQAFVRRVND